MQVFIHPQALVESNNIGDQTRIWAFVHILSQARIGSHCNICDHVFIENDVVIGDNVTIKSGVQLWDGLRVEDDVFIGPNATFTNDRFPRIKNQIQSYPQTVIQEGASIGANATILPGVTIARNAMVGAGCVVLSDVPPNGIVVGNPARIAGYDSKSAINRKNITKLSDNVQANLQIHSSVKGVRLINLPVISDVRGCLTYAQHEGQLPFVPRRFFLVFDVPSRESRGEHAHKTLKELLVCVKGTFAVMVDDGNNREEYIFDKPGQAIFVPPKIWRAHYKYTKDAIMLVQASDIYDADDYVRDYEKFTQMIKNDDSAIP